METDIDKSTHSGKYTLGRLRREVFRALDEYSSNGTEHEIYSGGTGDMDKRFVSALNSAIRLICLSTARYTKKLSVKLTLPTILMRICPFEVKSESPADILLPEISEAISFDFCGAGSASVFGASGEKLCEYSFKSEFGIYDTVKKVLPGGAHLLVFETQSHLSVKNLRSYDGEGSLGACGEEYIPDGKNVFCALPRGCFEICSASAEKHGRIISCPTDIFSCENGILSCSERFAGEYTLEYYEYPEEISETDTPDTPLPLSPAAYGAAVYATAAELCAREDGELYSRLTYKYREILANAYPTENLKQKNSFFAGGIFGRRKKQRSFWG